MILDYKPKGVCPSNIHIELDGTRIKNVTFTGGCSGNTQGVAKLIEGMEAEDAIQKLKGIRCGVRPTSCPDQLARALEKMLQNNEA